MIKNPILVFIKEGTRASIIDRDAIVNFIVIGGDKSFQVKMVLDSDQKETLTPLISLEKANCYLAFIHQYLVSGETQIPRYDEDDE